MTTIVIDIDGTISALSEKALAELGDIEYVRTRMPFKGVAETINQLHRKGVKIIFHTSRREHLRKETEMWFAKHKIQYDELVMNRPVGDLILNDKAFPLKEWRWNVNDAKKILRGIKR